MLALLLRLALEFLSQLLPRPLHLGLLALLLGLPFPLALLLSLPFGLLLPLLLGLPLPVLLLGLFLEGFLLLPVVVLRGGGGHAALDLGAVDLHHRTLDGVALGIAQGAVNLPPFVLQSAQFFPTGLGLAGVLLVVEPLVGGLPGPAFVASGGGSEMLGRFVVETAFGVAAGVELRFVASLFQGVVGPFGPARPLPFGQVLDVVTLAVNRVEFDGLAAQFALGGDAAGRQQDVGCLLYTSDAADE